MAFKARLGWCGLMAALISAVGCSGAQEPPVTEPGALESAGIPDIPDDTCHLLEECWDLDAFADTDGCPTEPEIPFAEGSAALPDAAERGQAEMAAEIAELGARLRRLRITGYASDSEAPDLALARAQAVRDDLVDLGVPPDILEITAEQLGERGYVVFVVTDCDPVESY